MNKKKKTLIIDDDPQFVSLMQKKLKRLNCEVEEAFDGVEGLNKVKSSPPDLIVLDVMMPNKDGFQTCRELKLNEKYSHIPVIMLTAVADHISSSNYTLHDAKNMQAEDYIPKGPGCTSEVLNSINEFLEA